jgi:hypothetical protein
VQIHIQISVLRGGRRPLQPKWIRFGGNFSLRLKHRGACNPKLRARIPTEHFPGLPMMPQLSSCQEQTLTNQYVEILFPLPQVCHLA